MAAQLLVARTNDALKINPPTGLDFHISTHGSDWLWAVTSVYALSLIIVVGLTYFAKQGEKILHYLFTISLFVGTVAYFTMASDLGWTAVLTADNAEGTRQIFYTRYINWYVLPGFILLLLVPKTILTTSGLLAGLQFSSLSVSSLAYPGPPSSTTLLSPGSGLQPGSLVP